MVDSPPASSTKMEEDAQQLKVSDQDDKSPQPPSSENASTREVANGDAEKVPPTAASLAPPPNSGLKAWLQVFGGFLFVLNSWGMANSFGVFQTYYTTTLLSSSTPSEISWIGSIQAFLLLFVGVACGRALDAGHYNLIVIIGTFLEVFGMMMLSLSTEYYQAFLSQGICVGVGSGLIFTPAVSVVGTYFTTKRAFAMGIVASGSSVGGIIYPIVIRQLILHSGFPWAARVMGFIMLASLIVGFALLRPRVAARKSGPLFDLESFKDLAYTAFVIGLALAFMAYFVPFFYIESQALRLGASPTLAFYLLSIMNAAGVAGRILPNFVADKIGNLNVIIPITYISGIICLLWLTAKSSPNLIAVSVMYGFFSGGLTNSAPSVVGLLSPELNKIGTRIGMMLTVCSIGALIGPPIAGAILKAQSPADNGALVPAQANYTGVFVFAGVGLLAGAICMHYTRAAKKGFFFWGKV